MRTIQFISILTISLFLASGPTGAQTVVFGDPTMPTTATGINNLEVGGIHYDVVFLLFTEAVRVYGPWPGDFDIFDTATEAEDAVDAVNSALNDALATSVGNLDQPGQESPIYNIGYESLLILQLQSVDVWRGGIQGVDWVSLGQNSWLYNADPKTYADFNITTAVDDDVADIPKAYKLFVNYPNPFNPTTMIQYYVPTESKVTLLISDVNGDLVKTLVDGVQRAGQKSATWNGRNNRGQLVASGMYFYRLSAEGFSQTRKMILLK